MNILYVDTETFSTLDIRKVGTVKYAHNCEPLLLGFLRGTQYECVQCKVDPIPEWVIKHIQQGGTVCAHNALFDYLVLKPIIPELNLAQMKCTEAKALAHGLPASLEKACIALGAPEDKQKDRRGKALIRLFCIVTKETAACPMGYATRTSHPAEWQEFQDYLKQDVEALEWLDENIPDLTPFEQIVWKDTQEMNLDGIPVDTKMIVDIANRLVDFTDEYATRFVRMTGIFPTQVEKIVRWVNNNGYICSDLTASTVEKIIEDETAPNLVRDALAVRANISHAAFKKYPAMVAATSDDDTVKGCIRYHAAHTGRFGGRLIQPHNFPRGSIDAVEAVEQIKSGDLTVDAVKSAVRGMIWHPEGFVIADYAAIEARVLHWLAGDEEMLNIFRTGGDPYKVMASLIYDTDVEHVTKDQRFVGKQAVLGLGYQMGHNKFRAQAASYGVEVPPQVCIKAVMTYRRVNDRVVALWGTLEHGVKLAMESPGKMISANRYIKFIRPPNSLFLYMCLPSGRRIAYPYPEFNENEFRYMSVEMNQWRRNNTYGGKLVENAVQGIARDVLVDAMVWLQASMPVAFHVHDEIVCIGDDIETVKKAMETVPDWAPGLPLSVDAHYVPRFKKI